MGEDSVVPVGFTEHMAPFDVFISYAKEDVDWVRVLAGRLHQAGLEVFLDEWEIRPGDVLVHSLEEGIRASACGVLVFSPQAVASRQVMEEYAALLSGGRRFVPVLCREVELPPFAASRVPVDFRHTDGPAYDRAVAALVRALRGKAPGERPSTGEFPIPPGSGFRAEGLLRARLTLDTDRIVLADLDNERSAEVVPGGRAALAHRLRELDQVRRGAGHVLRQPAEAVAVDSPVQRSLHEVGALLGEMFTPDPLAPMLTGLSAAARARRSALRLQIAAGDGMTDLPWEALIPPDSAGPIALDPSIQPYRSVSADGPALAVRIPPPLRILVVLASPEGADGGPLLDVEHELATILDAVEPARKHARAYVQVLNVGTLDAIREALTAQRYHILHISCHAQPRELLLEDAGGRPHRVRAEELISAIPAGRCPAVIVLAGCSTARSTQDNATVLPGLARELLAAGVPQVVAMTAPVTDRYAAWFGGRMYRELALTTEPAVVAAVADARRQVESARRELPAGSRDADLVEWATPVVFVRGEPQSLYDPAEHAEALVAPGPPSLAAGIPLRPVGDFVGRRAELRTLGAVLRRHDHPGAVVHGIGGAGKSSLVAELLRLLEDDAGLIVSMVGAAGPDQILDALGRALFTQALRNAVPDTHPDRQLAAYLRTPGETWSDRLQVALEVLGSRPVTLLLDNFETNLDPQSTGTGTIRDEALAIFLTAWIRSPGAHRLLVTSRYPFPLPEGAERRLEIHHLGPLSLAETRKLIWRLPGLDALTREQQQRAWTDVGGHPRTLEYLDALLRQGRARFPDVTERLERLIAAAGIADPAATVDSGSDRLERALSEVVTLAVNDTLVHDLVDLLDPAARKLLVGAAVYRRPSDRLALAWQVNDPDPIADDPARDERITRLHDAWRAAKAAAGTGDVGRDDLGLSPDQWREIEADLAVAGRPPLNATTINEGLPVALTGLGLLTVVADPQQEEHGYLVHRWTGAALARLDPDATRLAHLRAAAYYDWRVEHRAQDPAMDLYDLVEARHHYHAAGDLSAAVERSYQVRARLSTWSAWDWEARICAETLTWLPGDTVDTVAFLHRLGSIAENRGDYAEAEGRYLEARAISEELGDRAGSARLLGQLGNLSHRIGDYQEAQRHYEKALSVLEELDDRVTLAAGYHQVGILAQDRGDYVEAGRRYRQSLAIEEGLRDKRGTADSLVQLGSLAYLTGDHAEAERLCQQALSIYEEIGNRDGAAAGYHQLGLLAQKRGDHPEAERRYRQSLTVSEEIGNRAGMAHSNQQLGRLALERDDYPEAERWLQLALARYGELGSRVGVAACYSQLGWLRMRTSNAVDAVPMHIRAMAIRIDMDDAGVSFNLSALASLRDTLGESRFDEAAAASLDATSLAGLKGALDQIGDQQNGA
jgi:tetratricopeptide (TPR) repeat protein